MNDEPGAKDPDETLGLQPTRRSVLAAGVAAAAGLGTAYSIHRLGAGSGDAGVSSSIGPGGAPTPSRQLPPSFDVVIIGGGLGGMAAAEAVAAHGHTVALVEETDWLGGQITVQGVPPDENFGVESFGSSKSYATFRNSIRSWYRKDGGLTPAAASVPILNPGKGFISRITALPAVVARLADDLLQPYVASGKLRVIKSSSLVSVVTDGDTVRQVTVQGSDGTPISLEGSFFLDATPEGILVKLSGTEYVTGSEARSDTHELHAPDVANPHNYQAATHCFAIEYYEGQDFTIAKPDHYDEWRAYVPRLTPPYPGPLLNWYWTQPGTNKTVKQPFDPNGVDGHEVSWWKYRRVLDRASMINTPQSDITIVNWPMNDYFVAPIIDVSPDEERRRRDEAKQLSRCFLYWLQTEAENPNHGGTPRHGFPGVKLSTGTLGTADGFAKRAYIREGRRIRAVRQLTENEIGSDAVRQLHGLTNGAVQPPPVAHSVGIGHYNLDLHPTTGGDNSVENPCVPFQIPLACLIPVRMKNVLPASLCVGTTHITNGALRTHQCEWSVGEAAGNLAVYCLANKVVPRGVEDSETQYEKFKAQLVDYGVRLAWPANVYKP